MPTAVIVDAVRTPLGKRNGSLKDWHPVDLAAHTLEALIQRNDLDPALVEDVIMGCVMQVGNQGLNIGRNAVLAAGFPESVPATSVDRQCGSSQQAAHFAAQGVMAGAYDIVIAAGVESMSRVPMGADEGQIDGHNLALRKKVSLESRPFSKGARKDKKGADGLAPLDRARKAGSQWAVDALTR